MIMYRAEVIMRMASPPDVCNRLLINGGFNLGKKFDPRVDDLWQKITCPISKDQVIDVDCKILRKNGKIVTEGSVQYRDRRYENGIQIRCDNYHGSDSFHMDKLTGTNAPKRSKWKREWKRPIAEPFPKSSMDKFRLALHKVLQYVEENYDFSIAPKFFFPFDFHFGTKISEVLTRLKPKDISLSQYSELIAIITASQIERKRFESLKDWIKKLVVPATMRIEEAIQKGEDIILVHEGVLTMLPVPIFVPPKSQFKWEVWSSKQQSLNLKPIAIVFEKKAQQ